MKVFKSKNAKIKNIVRNIDESIIQRLIQSCIKIKKTDEYSTIYSKFYKTKYPVQDLSEKEQRLEEYLNKLVGTKTLNVRTKLQGKEYRWVLIDENHLDTTAFRYYFAPNPSNMHEIVKRLTAELVAKKIPVMFKFQLKDKMDECDRIILYSDFEHQQDIEKAIQSVYQQQPELFDGSERPLSWIYTSETPNVYLAPETPGSSYGEEFARTMIEAKEMFCYLYGITETNHKIKLDGEEAKKALDYMELIVCSLLLRKRLILSKDGKRIIFKDNIKSFYDYKSGELTSFCDDSYGHHSVAYSQTIEGKNALLSSFYGISQMQSQNGVKVEHLTQQERRRQLYETFGWYADEFKNQANNNPIR